MSVHEYYHRHNSTHPLLMADTTTDATPVTSTEGVSKETFDETKKLADERAAKLAAAEARLQAYESRERAQLQSFQPAMQGLITELANEFATPETKAHFDSFGDWTRTCHERGNLDTQMQLGTVIHACASKLKRTREDASVQSATAEQLATATKELEEAKDALGAKERRIGELSDSLKEIQANSEKLQLQLEKAGMLAEKFDFSKASSREQEAPAATGEVVKTTENASKGALGTIPTFSPTDALVSFANAHGGNASSRFVGQNGSNHSLLGPQAGLDLAGAIRPMEM